MQIPNGIPGDQVPGKWRKSTASNPNAGVKNGEFDDLG
jgi:hypothetical protein